MTSFLGTLELPLTILAWCAVAFVVSISLLTVIILVSEGISDYKKHKQQLRWDDLMKGVRR